MHTNISLRPLARFTSAFATALVITGLILAAPSVVSAQSNTAPNSEPNAELFPAINIVRPATGRVYGSALTTANGYVHRQQGSNITAVKVVLHRDSGGSGRGYLDSSGQFQDVTSENSSSYYRPALINAEGTWSVALNLPAGDLEGRYTLRAVARNVAGLESGVSRGFSIEVGYTISGSVRNRNNSGVSGVPVGARPSDGNTWQETTTDSQGSYTLPNLSAGSWVVTVRDRISDPHFTNVTLTQNVRYGSASFFIGGESPASPYTISGAVRTRDNRGVEGVPVGARPSNSSAWRTVNTDAQGSYTIADVTPGEWVVTVRDRISDPHDTTVTITNSVPFASASFFIGTSGPLIDGMSQSGSDAFRRTGIPTTRITQTYGFAPASEGVHASSGRENGELYSNAIDLSLPSNNIDDIARELHTLRMAGFAAWYRTEEQFPRTGAHIHAIYGGASNWNLLQNQQLRSFGEGRVGLASSEWVDEIPITQDEIDAVVNLYASVNGPNALSQFRTYENGWSQRHPNQ